MMFPGLGNPPPPPAQAAPVVVETTPMPDPDDQEIKAERSRKFARERQKRGRMSTINTEQSPLTSTLGG